MTGPRRGLVLGSGGVLGFAWLLGALSALEQQAEVDPATAEVVIGTSAGSVAAALLGCGLSVDTIIRHQQGIPAPEDPRIEFDYETGVGDALPPRPGWRPSSPAVAAQWLRHPRRVSGLVALTGLLPAGRGSLGPVRALVAGVAAATGHVEQWPQRPRPWIVAADQRTGRRVVFGDDEAHPRRGERTVRRARLADAVQASCSIPAWYPPTVIDGVPYVDGGAVSIASVDLAARAGLDEVFVLAPMAALDRVPARGTMPRLVTRVRTAITRRIESDVAQLRSAGVRVVFLAPGREDLETMGYNLMNPKRRVEVLETARVTSAARLRSLLGARGGTDPVGGRTAT